MPAPWQKKGISARENFKQKLTHEHKLFLYRCKAEGYTKPATLKLLKEQYNVDYSEGAFWLTVNTKKAKFWIEKFRETELQRIKDVPIAHKKVRLIDLEKTRTKLSDLIDTMDVKKKSDRQELLMMMRRLNETICVGREEMEAKPLILQQLNYNDFRDLTDDELQKRRDALLAKAKVIADQRRSFGAGETGIGVEEPTVIEPAQVSLASSEKL